MVREIPLTQGLVALVDDKDYDRVIQFKWFANKIRDRFYAGRRVVRNGKGTSESLHRFILNAAPGDLVDHCDGDGLNCTRQNIRFATHRQNQMNMRTSAANKSGFKGVFWRRQRNRWRAEIRVNSKKIYIGNFKSKEEAAQAYDEFARIHFGEFARLNFPEPGEQAA